MQKKVFSTLVILFLNSLFFAAGAQTFSGPFTVTGSGYSTAVVNDYQCLGINPANLGWRSDNKLVHIGIGELNFSIYSEPLKRSLVRNLFNSNMQFTPEEKIMAAENFTDTKLQFTGNFTALGVSFQVPKIGGFGFGIKERVVWNSKLNKESADILFQGYNAPYFDSLAVNLETGDTTGWSTTAQNVSNLFEGTYLEVAWFMEYNFSYGRKIYGSDLFSLYGGIGIKYLKGYSVFNYSYDNGTLRAYSALNPVLEVDYDEPSPSKIEGNDYQSIGKGLGFDFGLSALIIKKLRIAIALTDLGSIKWTGNVYSGENTLLTDIQTAGINNYNIFDLQNNLTFDNLKWGGWEGLKDKKTKLPTSLRTGAAFVLNKKIEFGSEFYIPMNEVPGAYDKLVFGVGTRLSPVKWFRGSVGIVSGGNTGTDIPVGISFLPINNKAFAWEMGFAVHDITTYFKQDKPTISMAMGLFRFSFGSPLSR